MKKALIILGIVVILVSFVFWFAFLSKNPSSPKTVSGENSLPIANDEASQVTIMAEELDTPWSMVFLPSKSMLLTERKGSVRLIDGNGKLQLEPVAIINNVEEIGEGGLLGITIHPNFSSNSYVYLYYTYSNNGENTLNRVVRMTYENKKLTNEQIIVDNIPGSSNHNGGRIKFGPDGYLYITTGDAQNPSLAQDKNALAGKILRVTDQGKIPSDNPFNNFIYSYGHRNPQGLAFDTQDRLWATEHGSSAMDEVNFVEKGKNYGWPEIRGDETREGMETAKLNSGPSVTWAPSGTAFYNKDRLFFSGLRGNALFEFNINNKSLIKHFEGQFGRIRDVVLGPDNMLYIATSNRDGRGNPVASDDRVIKINPQKLD